MERYTRPQDRQIGHVLLDLQQSLVNGCHLLAPIVLMVTGDKQHVVFAVAQF
jgi:hypothetical protein